VDQAETRSALALLRAAFERPETITPGAKDPVRTRQWLEHLANSTEQASLQQQIAETMAQAR
jgi:hypothetical protein